jgi:hydrogenase maturation protease
MIVIGVGNEFRGDDAAGIVAARWLCESGFPAEEHQGDMATLIERWKGADSLILIDAVAPVRTPGAIYRLDASAAPLDRKLFNTSTHAFSLADAVELSRVLATLPPHVLVFGIEARNLAMGAGLSREVEMALRRLVNEVLFG